ncbi:3-hydroxyacyl-CoA dehydrogenase family protein [Parapedobacter indicus]|uniref:3-hydroxyacyl-CoA dehydrogenase n=1 Tax=Parapedobacter indicus TaxID=1477437 RepID=A0A1I3GVN0_9SPHI|nr:3-hydroxyacyl-CoA dehydrogenase family protein [Parapedobacter indicus]PPL02796.1 3-hydroxyacyl-CoA dehydrogenase [Parapedobacter indicus]SFI27409.1 3-hydroxyacyl-CoA dehydrogenase [Parapedobacter indicus]
MDNGQIKPMQVGVVGLGLMGSSIVVSLLASGYPVTALAPIPGEKEKAAMHIADLLRHADSAGVLPRGIPTCIDALRLVEDFEQLADCRIVLECVVEDQEIKSKVYQQITASVDEDAIIASNTSAIPISELQRLVPRPERFLGIHWAEPAYMTRFLEVTCGTDTDLSVAEYVVSLGFTWGKEPTLLKKDIRGFITNRLMYAVYREALSLVEAGHTTLTDADKVFRYDAGAWITLMGIFRRMDFMGLEDSLNTLRQLFGQLDNREDVPAVMQQLVTSGAKGIHNRSGLYAYTEAHAKKWETAFSRFNRDIYELASRYNERNLFPTREEHIL